MHRNKSLSAIFFCYFYFDSYANKNEHRLDYLVENANILVGAVTRLPAARFSTISPILKQLQCMPTQTKENYLKAIFSISQKRGAISITELAEVMNVSKPTANSMVKKMKEIGWVIYEKYKPIALTANGDKVAALIVRKHRLAEMFLSKIMNFGWEEVHDIAEEMEHLRSAKLFDRMDEILGFPTTDPHGSPIPKKTGKIISPNYIKFTTLKVGESARLGGLSNSSKELLLFLNKKNIKLGTILRVMEIEEFDKSYEVTVAGSQSTILSYEVCKCLLVEVI